MRMSVIDCCMAGDSSASWANRCACNSCITKDTPPPFNPPSTTFGYTPAHVERGGAREPALPEDAEDGLPRPKAHIEGRMALDLLRESRASGRAKTTEILHHARAA